MKLTHTDDIYTVAVGSLILPAMRRELESQGIEVVRSMTTGAIARKCPDKIDDLMAEAAIIFRNCEKDPGGIALIAAHAPGIQLRELAAEICETMPRTEQREGDEEAAFLEEVGTL